MKILELRNTPTEIKKNLTGQTQQKIEDDKIKIINTNHPV